MKKILLSATTLVCLLSACSDDDQNYPGIGLEGKWNLTEVHTPMVAQVTTIEEGTVTWDFDESNQKLIVDNTNNNENSLNTGTYSYNIEAEESICNQSLYIDTPEYDFEIEYGCITIDGDTLSLSTAYVDGPIYVFIKE